MNLYVVRHGETAENKGSIMQGKMETYLDEEGIRQAKELEPKVRALNIDVVISSPYQRAYDTAKYVCPDKVIMKDDRLRSRNHGEFQGKARTEINLKDYWNIKKNIQYLEAESVKELFDRVMSLLEDIKNNYDGQNVMIVTHSGICRVLYYYFNGIPEDGDLTGYESTNCSLEHYEI